jgi:hypothetical protein
LSNAEFDAVANNSDDKAPDDTTPGDQMLAMMGPAEASVAPAQVDAASEYDEPLPEEDVSFAAPAMAEAPVAAGAPLAAGAPFVAPASFAGEVPDFKSRTVLDYAMANADYDQRPAMALARAMRHMNGVAEHIDKAVQFAVQAIANVASVEGFASRGKAELQAYVFDQGGLVDQLRTIFATERQLNREAATGGLLDAAERIEELTEEYGNAKLKEFDANALVKTAELDREMHRITLSSLQTTLASIVAEKTSLATDRAELEAKNRYSRRLGLAYGCAGLFAGIGVALATVLFH